MREIHEDLLRLIEDLVRFEREEMVRKTEDKEKQVQELKETLTKKHEVNRDIANCAILIQIEKEKLEKVLKKGGADAKDDKKKRQSTPNVDKDGDGEGEDGEGKGEGNLKSRHI